MKKFCVLFLLFSFQGFSQNEYFADNPVWRIDKFQVYDSNGGQKWKYNYYINGDTIVGPYTYKKVFYQCATYAVDFSPPSTTFISYAYDSIVPYFLIRSAGKKMFMHGFGITDSLLFDYNLLPGDTVPPSYANLDILGYQPFIVTSSDSILIKDEYRTRLFCEADLGGWMAYDTLIEGIGSNLGLIEDMYNNTFETTSDFLCYTISDTSYFPYYSPGPCHAPNAINENAQEDSGISIYPNPSNGEFSISGIPDPENTIVILDLIGRIVFEQTNVSDLAQLQLPVELPNGIYLYRVLSKEKAFFGKLILTR